MGLRVVEKRQGIRLVLIEVLKGFRREGGERK